MGSSGHAGSLGLSVPPPGSATRIHSPVGRAETGAGGIGADCVVRTGLAREGRRLAPGLALAVSGRLLAEIPSVVEWHRTAFFPRVCGLLQSISGTTAGTLGEVAAALLVCLAFLFLFLLRARAVGGVAMALGLVVLGFYAAWGLAYSYPPLASRLPARPVLPEDTLIQLAEKSARLLALAREGPVSLIGPDAEFLERVNAGLNTGFARWPESIEAAPVRGVAFGPAKPSRASWALSRLQISGYYFPWSGEAQIDAQMPRTLWPRVAAHEKAHQRGFARENEATVIGVITCLSSPDPTTYYGGALGLFVAFDREVAKTDPDVRRRMWDVLPAPVLLDLQNEAAFWKRHQGVASSVGGKVNDTYLKAQGIPSGARSYDETTELFIQAIETGLVDFRSVK